MPPTRTDASGPTLSARIQKTVMRLMFRLPDTVKRRIAGPAVHLDGQTLALDAQLMAEMSRRGGVSFVVNDSPGESRAAIENGRHALEGPRFKDVISEDLAIDSAGGDLHATLYTPRHLSTPAPLLVFFHGGGWVIGSRTSYDSLVSFLAHHAQVKIMSVEYRLAPEHPFPAAIDDALAAFEHAHRHADALGADRARIAVGGDSAGAHLSAVLAQLAARREGPRPSHQFLFYPATDFTRRHPSRDLFGEGFLLTDREIDWFEDQYAQAADRSDPRLSPFWVRWTRRSRLPTSPPADSTRSATRASATRKNYGRRARRWSCTAKPTSSTATSACSRSQPAFEQRHLTPQRPSAAICTQPPARRSSGRGEAAAIGVCYDSEGLR